VLPIVVDEGEPPDNEKPEAKWSQMIQVLQCYLLWWMTVIHRMMKEPEVKWSQTIR
jgi:hypothetical protein